MPPKIPAPGTYTTDTPLRLEIAAQLAFPDGSIGVPGLRKEIAKGTLPAAKIAGKMYVTLAGIEEMRKQCQVSQPPTRQPAPTRPAPEASGVPTEEDKKLAYGHLMHSLGVKNPSPPAPRFDREKWLKLADALGEDAAERDFNRLYRNREQKTDD